MATTKRTAKTAASACPNCSGFAADKRGKMTGFTLDGVRHVAPDMWLAGRSSRHSGGVEAVFAAMNDWAFGCELAARYEAQREQRHAA